MRSNSNKRYPLPARDIAKSTACCELALGLETVYLHEGTHAGEGTNFAVLICDDLEIHLILDEMPDKLSGMTAGMGHPYLRVANLDEMFAEVAGRGVLASRGIEMMAWGPRNFQLTDPAGNVVSVEEKRYA